MTLVSSDHMYFKKLWGRNTSAANSQLQLQTLLETPSHISKKTDMCHNIEAREKITQVHIIADLASLDSKYHVQQNQIEAYKFFLSTLIQIQVYTQNTQGHFKVFPHINHRAGCFLSRFAWVLTGLPVPIFLHMDGNSFLCYPTPSLPTPDASNQILSVPIISLPKEWQGEGKRKKINRFECNDFQDRLWQISEP